MIVEEVVRCGYEKLPRRAAMRTKKIERGAVDPRASTLEAIQRAFEKSGVVFLEPGDVRDSGEGVRLKKPEKRARR